MDNKPGPLDWIYIIPIKKWSKSPDKYTKEASDKPQDKGEYEIRPRRILNIRTFLKKVEPHYAYKKNTSSYNP